jgi:hypothetical protein
MGFFRIQGKLQLGNVYTRGYVNINIVKDLNPRIPHSLKGLPDPYCLVIDEPFQIISFQARTHAGRSWYYHGFPLRRRSGDKPGPVEQGHIRPHNAVLLLRVFLGNVSNSDMSQ